VIRRYAGAATATSLVQSKAFVHSLLQRLAVQGGGGGTGWYTAGRSVLFMRSPRLLQLLHDRLHAASTLQRWYRRALRRRRWSRRGESGTAERARRSGGVQTFPIKKEVELAAAGARAMIERARQHGTAQQGLSEYTRALESQLEGVQRAVGMDLTDADVRVEFWKSEARAARVTANVLLSTAVESMTVKLHRRAAELSNPRVA